jgi:phage virion morphogenesis protein
MSTLTLRLNLTGVDGVEAALAALAPLKSGVLLEALARLIRESVRERLLAGGPAPDGTAWQANRAGRTPILHRTGALARSIDYLVHGSSIVVGSSLIYAAIHQFGGVIRPKSGAALVFRAGNETIFARQVTMPARPYIGLSAEDRSEIILATAQYLRRLFP